MTGPFRRHGATLSRSPGFALQLRSRGAAIMATDLTAEATQGFEASAEARNPFYHSSASGIAWEFGRWMQVTGRTAPRDVRMSRGYNIRGNDMLISWNPKTNVCERID
jgi:hypothetical protein